MGMGRYELDPVEPWKQTVTTSISRYGLRQYPRQGSIIWGDIGSERIDDTWEWNGINWTQMIPANKPQTRYAHTMTYDSVRDKIVLFGGVASIGYNDETWEWDGTNWTQLNPVTKPSARHCHAMAYDSARGKVILFGGNLETGYSDDTWEWDGGATVRPAQMMQTAFNISGAKKWDQLTSVNATFYAGGISYPNATATNGAELIVWDEGLWKTVKQNTIGADGTFNDTSKLTWTTTDPQVMYRLFTGDQRALNFAVIPDAANGSASDMGEISVDYAEIIVRYIIPETKDEYAPSGFLDDATSFDIHGWACDKDAPAENIHIQLSFYADSTFLTTIDIGETSFTSEQAVQDICGEGSTTHRFAWDPSTSTELQQALVDSSISQPATLTVHATGINTDPVPPGSNTEFGAKEFEY